MKLHKVSRQHANRPETFNTSDVLGMSLGFPGDIALTPTVVPDEGNKTKAKVGILPVYDLKGARYGYRTALVLAQEHPGNWQLLIPGAGNAPINITTALGVPDTTFTVRPAVNPHGNTTDPYSVLPIQWWASRGSVAFARPARAMTAAIRRDFTMAVTAKNDFGYAGYSLDDQLE